MKRGPLSNQIRRNLVPHMLTVKQGKPFSQKSLKTQFQPQSLRRRKNCQYPIIPP